MQSERRTVRLITKAAVLCVAASLLVPLAAQPASTATNPDNPTTPTIDSGGYTPTPGNTIAFKPTGPTQGGNPVQLTGCWQNNALGNLVPCGGGGGGGSSPPPYVPPPAPPPQPARPAKPTPPVPVMECRTIPPANTDLVAETSFDVTADSNTQRFEHQVLWSRSNNRAGASTSMAAEIAAARRALTHAQLPSTQQAATDAATAAQSARDTADAAAEAEHEAQVAFDVVDAAAQTARGHRDDAHTAQSAAQTAAADAETAVNGLRTQPAPTLTPATYTADTTLTADLHASKALISSLTAQAARQAAEDERDTAQQQAALADSPAHPSAAVAVAVADAAAEAAQLAEDAYNTANDHYALAAAQRTAAQTALTTARDASSAADAAYNTAQANMESANEAADVTALQQALDTLVSANDANTLLLDDSPVIRSGTGTSSIGSPPIASFDHLYVSVSVRTSVRTSASNAGGTSWSPWSDWSDWSDWSQRAGNGGDPWIDTNGNGRWDSAEPFTDTNGNGQWDTGEPYTDLGNGQWDVGEAFVDALNGRWDPGESFSDANGNGAYDRGDPFDDYNNNGVRDVDVDVLFDFNDNDLWDGAEPLYDANGNFTWDGGFIVDVDPNIDPVELAAITRQWFGNVSEPYHDADGDGAYDAPETWTDVLNGTYDPGETFTDQGNGSYDPDEPWTDANSNGIYDPPVGCPIPSSPSTPINTLPCSHDPTLIAAVYPPGHPQAGQRTGHCYPFGSPCLPPPNGTGALDVVCLPRGS